MFQVLLSPYSYSEQINRFIDREILFKRLKSSKVKFNPQNNDYAPWFYTRNGLVQVMELNIDKRQKPERLRSVSNHLHRTVSCIHWDPSGQKLYTADNIGNVVVANIPSSKVTTGNAIRWNNWFNNNFVKCVKFWSSFLIISTW